MHTRPWSVVGKDIRIFCLELQLWWPQKLANFGCLAAKPRLKHVHVETSKTTFAETCILRSHLTQAQMTTPRSLWFSLLNCRVASAETRKVEVHWFGDFTKRITYSTGTFNSRTKNSSPSPKQLFVCKNFYSVQKCSDSPKTSEKYVSLFVHTSLFCKTTKALTTEKLLICVKVHCVSPTKILVSRKEHGADSTRTALRVHVHTLHSPKKITVRVFSEKKNNTDE